MKYLLALLLICAGALADAQTFGPPPQLSDPGLGGNEVVPFINSGRDNGQVMDIANYTVKAIAAGQGVPLPVFTVATLPTCAAANSGTLAAVSDATTPAYNATLTGGGAVLIPVLCNGSAWTAH